MDTGIIFFFFCIYKSPGICKITWSFFKYYNLKKKKNSYVATLKYKGLSL